MSEPILEPILRKLRFNKGVNLITHGSVVVDIGSGPYTPFLSLIKNKIKRGIGIDPLTKVNNSKNISVIKSSLEKKIPIEDCFSDYVSLFAVLEHLDHPQELLSESYRILKKDGKIILTTPTPFSKLLCEFFAYKLHLISDREVREHKRYFWKNDLVDLLKNAGYKNIQHNYFEFFFNNFVVAQK